MTDATAPDARDEAAKQAEARYQDTRTHIFVALSEHCSFPHVGTAADAVTALVRPQLEAVYAAGLRTEADRYALAARVAGLEDQREADGRWSETAAELLAAVVAPACETDRYGNCATHGVLVLDEGSQCPHVLARAFLSSSRLHLKTQQPAPAPAEQAAGDGEAELRELADTWLAWFDDGGDDSEAPFFPERRSEIADHLRGVLAALDRLRRLERERAATPCCGGPNAGWIHVADCGYPQPSLADLCVRDRQADAALAARDGREAGA